MRYAYHKYLVLGLYHYVINNFTILKFNLYIIKYEVPQTYPHIIGTINITTCKDYKKYSKIYKLIYI